MATTTYTVDRELVAIFLTKKEASALVYLLGNAEANINARDELDGLDKRALKLSQKIKVRDLGQ